MQALLHFLALVIRCAPALIRSQGEQVVVELALRQQLATYSQKKVRPRITPLDRAFWIALFRFWSRWKRALVIVKPDTVVRWHRKGFRLYWRWISKRGPGRPPLAAEVQELIRRFAAENGCGRAGVACEYERFMRNSASSASRSASHRFRGTCPNSPVTKGSSSAG